MKPLILLDKNDYQKKGVIVEGYDLIETDEEYSFKSATLKLSLQENYPLSDELIYIRRNSNDSEIVYMVISITTDDVSQLQTVELIEYAGYINYLGLEVHRFNNAGVPTSGDELFITTPYRLDKLNSNGQNQLVHNFSMIGINLSVVRSSVDLSLSNGFMKLSDFFKQVKDVLGFYLSFQYRYTADGRILIYGFLDSGYAMNRHLLNVFDLDKTLTTSNIADFYEAAYPIFKDDREYSVLDDYYAHSWILLNTHNGGQLFPRNISFYPNDENNFIQRDGVPENQLKYWKYNGSYHIFLRTGTTGTDLRPGIRKSLGISVTLNSNKSMGRYYLLYWDLVNKLEEHNNQSIRDALRKNSVKKNYRLKDTVSIVNGNSYIIYHVSKTVKNLNSDDYTAYLTEG
jgi:hypothetical protein